MSNNAEAKLGKSLDAIIEENRAKLGTRGRGGGGGGSSRGRGGGRPAGGGARVGRPAGGGGGGGGRLRGIAGLSGRGASRAATRQANEVVVGNTRYVKAPGVAGGGVSKAGGGGRRRRSGGGGGAGGGGVAAFMHDDRTGMGGFADEYGVSDVAPAPIVGGGGRRMRGRLQRGAAAGVEDRWQHDMFDPHEQAAAPPRRAGRLAGAPAAQPTRVLIANLNYTVTQEDLEELFSAAGEVLSVNLDYDRTDRLTGTGSVVFRSHKQAEKALAEFNGAKLDGKPMRLAIDESAVVLSSGKSVQLPSASRPAARAAAMPRASRGGGRGRGGGRLRSVVGGGRPTRSAQDLDAEMNDYMQE